MAARHRAGEISLENGKPRLSMNRENEVIELEAQEEPSNDDPSPESEENRDKADEQGLGSQNRLRIPVVPLRGTVVFPSVAAPIAGR